jgi:signal transduction histidine kinase
VVAIYMVTAVVAISLLVAVLVNDVSHQRNAARDALLLATETRAHYLGRELGLLAGELRRLGVRSEVDLLDENLEPEQSLLRLSHEHSAFFNVGVAIVDRGGKVLWALPSGFLTAGQSVAGERWFRDAQHDRDVRIVPVSPESERDALVYLVSPVIRNEAFSGALIGAIDLGSSGELEIVGQDPQHAMVILATHDGTVVYPAKPPAIAAEPTWRRLFQVAEWEPFVTTASLGGATQVIASDRVPSSDLVLLSLADQDRLFAPARARLRARLALGLVTVLVPFLLLVLLLRRTLRVFQHAQEAAARGQRLRLLGEAANLIAHEVKNSLNGLQVGLDLLLMRAGAEGKPTAGAMRTELSRLSSFTTKLLTFSKGVVPRPAPMDFSAFVRKLGALAADQAQEAGVELAVEAPEEPIELAADSALVHVVVSNLLNNAIDALSPARAGTPRVVLGAGTLPDGRAFVRVADNGPGVAASVQRALFEPFVTGKPSGVGIGLALSRKIARAHGGDLVLEPTAVGASFLFTLPRKKGGP